LTERLIGESRAIWKQGLAPPSATALTIDEEQQERMGSMRRLLLVQFNVYRVAGNC